MVYFHPSENYTLNTRLPTNTLCVFCTPGGGTPQKICFLFLLSSSLQLKAVILRSLPLRLRPYHISASTAAKHHKLSSSATTPDSPLHILSSCELAPASPSSARLPQLPLLGGNSWRLKLVYLTLSNSILFYLTLFESIFLYLTLFDSYLTLSKSYLTLSHSYLTPIGPFVW